MLKKYISIFAAAAIFMTSALSFASCVKVNTVVPETTTESVIEEPVIPLRQMSPDRNPLTGLGGYEQGYAGQKFIGIVVENFPEARPQWGMSTPDILMEYEVEGGISRMLWLYANASRIPAKVGPVRSARHDPVELALGGDMLFIHCGGSYIALGLIDRHPELSHIDGMRSYDFFIRDTERNTAYEHRLCLIGDKFREQLGSLDIDMTADPEKTVPFIFSDQGAPRALNGTACSDIRFSYSDSYRFEFTYDAGTSLYLCSLNGSPRTDDAGIQCAYSNVMVLYTDIVDTGDSDHHQDFLFENGGKGLYINGGVCEEITWAKPTQTDMLKLYGADGNELVLNCGTSYIGFVRSTRGSLTSIE